MRFVAEGDVNFQLDQLLNEGLEFSDNLKGALLEADLVIGDNTIQHGLGFVPIGYIIIHSGTRSTPVSDSGIDTELRIVRRAEDDFIEVLDALDMPQDFVGVRISEWTTEILFLNANVESLGVRLFVL